MGIGKQSILIQGKWKQARHARTLFDDGRKSRLLCIALSKTQSEKFLPHGFSHESKLESASNPRLVWPRTECGPDTARRSRPVGRQYPGIARKPRRPSGEFGQACTTLPLILATTTHGPRSSQGTSLIPSSYSPLHFSFPRLSF
jgi:hypothetical protein